MLFKSWAPSRVKSHRLAHISWSKPHKDPLCWLEADRGHERGFVGRELSPTEEQWPRDSSGWRLGILEVSPYHLGQMWAAHTTSVISLPLGLVDAFPVLWACRVKHIRERKSSREGRSRICLGVGLTVNSCTDLIAFYSIWSWIKTIFESPFFLSQVFLRKTNTHSSTPKPSLTSA